jgi:hypothetical protein
MPSKRDSRFNDTETTVHDGAVTLGPWVMPEFLQGNLPDDQVGRYAVPPEFAGRPGSIANVLYGSSNLYWVLIAFNNPAEVLNWPRANEIIRYPLENIVMTQLT